MLRSDATYNLLFRFQNLNLNNINDIYFVINIIFIIAMTLFEALIVVIFIFKLVIVIVVIVIEIFVIVVLIFKEPVFKFIVFDFNIKRRLAMSVSLNNRRNL